METVPVPGSICSPSLGRPAYLEPTLPTSAGSPARGSLCLKPPTGPQGGVEVEAALAAEDTVFRASVRSPDCVPGQAARLPGSQAAAAWGRESQGRPACCAAAHTLPGSQPTLQAGPLGGPLWGSWLPVPPACLSNPPTPELPQHLLLPIFKLQIPPTKTTATFLVFIKQPEEVCRWGLTGLFHMLISQP